MKNLRLAACSLLLSFAALCAEEAPISVAAGEAHSARSSTAASPAEFPFKANDRVAWIGSSSTRIGTWCRTMEFLLRTRHPELNLVFFRGTTGGGTFATGVKYLPGWLEQAKPTYVLFNYGGNDAAGAAKALDVIKSNMQKCVDLVLAAGARVEFVTPQSGDVRATAQQGFDNRKLLSEIMLAFASEKQWPIYDTHHPLEHMQLEEQKEIPDYTINRDKIHLTDSAYIAWGFYLYDCMHPPVRETLASLNADGSVRQSLHCRIENAAATADGLDFTRSDDILPLLPPDPIPSGNPFGKGSIAALGAALNKTVKVEFLPTVDPNFLKNIEPPVVKTAVPASVVKTVPSTSTITTPVVKAPAAPPVKIPPAQIVYAAKFGNKLPPRTLTPLEKYSRYMLRVNDLPAGNYALTCEGKPLGTASHSQLAAGVNLNSLVLDNKLTAPWFDLAKALWLGKNTEQIGHTHWKFGVHKVAE